MERDRRNSQENIAAILDNVRDVSGDVRSATEGQDTSVREIVENIRTLTGTFGG